MSPGNRFLILACIRAWRMWTLGLDYVLGIVRSTKLEKNVQVEDLMVNKMWILNSRSVTGLNSQPSMSSVYRQARTSACFSGGKVKFRKILPRKLLENKVSANCRLVQLLRSAEPPTKWWPPCVAFARLLWKQGYVSVASHLHSVVLMFPFHGALQLPVRRFWLTSG